ncbi:MAG: leucine-rich repeat protein [Clostridia bacterium]|nr:leucine-rich repeat protein [Clostridia bacterium]
MKKRITIIFCLVLLAALLPLTMHSASAEETSGQCGDDLYWSFDESTGTLTITGSGDMYSYSETTIPWEAYRTQMKAVIFPEELKSIGSYAFYGCAGLQSVTIPDSVTSIGNNTFNNCTELTEITIPDSVTSIGEYAFYVCSNLTGITIPDGVTSIGNNTFNNCTGLTEITIPDSVTSIGEYAFSNCTRLTEISIPDSVTSIRGGTFYRCTGLTSVSIGNGVTSIGYKAFSYCTGLSEITIPDSVTYIGDRAFENCTGLTSVTIGSGVTSIGWYAFCECTSLSEITIPDSVTSIGRCAFENCTGLTSITMPCSVTVDTTSSYSASFDGCKAISCVHLTKGTGVMKGYTSYDYAPWNVSQCEEVTIILDDGIVSIIGNAFRNCTRLKSFVIPESVRAIGDNAFYGCTGLQSITIGNGVTSIGSYAFYGCTGLTSVTIGEGVISIGERVFYGCRGLSEITIPDSVTSIGGEAFYSCTGLTEITIGNGVTSIGLYAFSGCSNLSDVFYHGTLGLRESTLSIGDGNTCLVNAEWHYLTPNSIEMKTLPNKTIYEFGETLSVTGGFVSVFYDFDITEEVELTESMVSGFDNTRSGKQVLTVVYEGKTTSFEVEVVSSIEINRENFPDPTFRRWILGNLSVSGNASDGYYMTWNQRQKVTKIDLSDQSNIETLVGIEHFKNLVELDCTNNQLSELDVSSNTALTRLFCNGNRLSTLLLGSNSALKYIFCNDNQLTTLDIRNIPSLRYLTCINNHLTELDVGNNTLLEYLNCSYNQIKVLDVSKNVTLQELYCFNNHLTELDLSRNSCLKKLQCNMNQIAYLDLSTAANLTPQNTILSMQLIENQTGLIIDGKYAFDLSALIPAEYRSYVRMENANDSYDPTTGIVTFNSKMPLFEYHFNSGCGDMEVFVSLSYPPTEMEGVVEWNSEDVKFKGSTAYVIANGSAQMPRFTVKNSADGAVIDPEFYDYEYRENTNAGTGYVIVTFKGEYSGTCRGSFKIYLPPTTSTTVANVKDGIKLTWAPVEGAAGYVIYRRAWSSTTNGWTDFVRWNNTTALEWLDKTVYAGTRYQYGVKAYFARRTDPVTGAEIGGNVGDNFNLGQVGPLKTTVRITTRTLKSVTAGTKQLTVKWAPSSQFTGYQVQYATNSAFTKGLKTVKITNPKTSQTVVKNLKTGTTYYVRVRSYHEFNGMTYYGEWSNALSGKVK